MNATFDIRIKVCIKAQKKGNFIGKLTKFKTKFMTITSSHRGVSLDIVELW